MKSTKNRHPTHIQKITSSVQPPLYLDPCLGKLYVFSVQYTWNESNINHAIPCNSWVWSVQPHHQVCPPRYPMCAIVNCWIRKPKAMGNDHQSIGNYHDLYTYKEPQFCGMLGWHPHHPSHGASKNARNFAMTPTFIRHETASILWLLNIAMEATSQPCPILLNDLWWFTVFLKKMWVSIANCYITRG